MNIYALKLGRGSGSSSKRHMNYGDATVVLFNKGYSGTHLFDDPYWAAIYKKGELHLVGFPPDIVLKKVNQPSKVATRVRLHLFQIAQY